MAILILFLLNLWFKLSICDENGELFSNSSDPNKDMYVIHAMVYQVGIVTNKTDGENFNGTIGNQEALTLYSTNGSHIDLSDIPTPLMTNVTAQSLVGVAPKDGAVDSILPPSSFNNLTNGILASSIVHSGTAAYDSSQKMKRSWKDSFSRLFKRDVSGDSTVKITKGTAEIPESAGLSSIALPPLLTLNNNFSDIPVPIPNTSVVHYAKINTLVHAQ